MSLLRRIVNLFVRSRVHREIDAELQSHIALRIDDNIARGMSPVEARRDALLRFGNPTVIQERVAASDAALTIESIGRDLRYAARQLRRSPGFAITAIITLALGIGANLTVFGVLNSVLLHPLEVSDPHNLYQLRHQAWMQGRLLTSSYPAFEDMRRRNSTFTDMAAVSAYSHAAMNWNNSVVSISGDEVTGNYFDLLGIQPQLGRFFHTADEHGPGSAPFLVLSDALWRRAFNADPAILGATVDLNKHPFIVIGIVPAQFHGTEKFAWPDYWIPMLNEEQVEGSDYLHRRASVSVTVLGRLKPGVTPRQATDDLDAIAAQLAREYPETDDGQPVRLIHPGLIGDAGDVIRGFLWSVSALALLVLLAACANLATLFAARAADRSRELALRIALGSTRSRILRQLLTEAMLLSLLGGAAGLATASLLLRIFRDSPYGHIAITMDSRVYLAGFALTFASALFFGILPAQHAWQSSPLQRLKNGPDALYLRRFTLRDLLLGAQIAICTLLVTASLVAVRGLLRELHTPLGFHPQGAMLVDIDLGSATQDIPPTRLDPSILNAALAIPGVTAAGVVSRTPFTGGMHGVPIFLPGAANFKINNSALSPFVFQMSPGYLAAAGTRLLSGRDFSWHDTANTPRVAIVNQVFAQKMWGRSPAIGQHFIVNGDLTEVIGVVEDGKYHDMQESPQPVAFLSSTQSDTGESVFVIRSQRSPSEMSAALQHALGSIVPNAPITIRSWSDAISGELFPAQAAAAALGGMGLLAAMLAVTGIFGMAAYSVSRRIRELAIRVALGARNTQLISAAIGRPISLLTAGSALGLLFGLSARGLMSRIVYQGDPRDPLVICAVIATMAFLGAFAAFLPAQRALRINPSRLMREE